MFKDEDVSKVKELMAEPKRIRNVALYDRKIEECFAFPHLLITEKQDLFYFADREKGIKHEFGLQSKIQRYHDGQYLFNLVDAPNIGNYDGFVHSMHLVDGIVVSVYSSQMLEEILRSVLSQGVKPILFINDIHKLSDSLNYDAAAIRQEIDEIISTFNELVKIHAPADKKEEWQIDIASVIFGSILHGFAFDFQEMKESGIEFAGMIEEFRSDKLNLTSKFPLHRVLARAIIEHLPSPCVAETYRIPRLRSMTGGASASQSMMNSYLEDSLTSLIIYNKPNKQYYCRVFSGTLHSGDEAYLEDYGHNISIETEKSFGEVPRGNLIEVNVSGYDFEGDNHDVFLLFANRISRFRTLYRYSLSSVFAGFLPADYAGGHVYSVSLRNRSDDLSKFIRYLHSKKQDPTFKVRYYGDGSISIRSVSAVCLNELIEGIKRYFPGGAEMSEPFARYKESVLDKSGPVKVESENKRNAFSFEVEPLDEAISDALYEYGDNVAAERLMELGMDRDEASRIWQIQDKNMFLNMTDDVPFLDEAKPLLLKEFELIIEEGSSDSEGFTGLKVKLVDAEVHEDRLFRLPSEIVPPVTKAINDAVMLANPYLLEQVQKVFISGPIDCLDGCIQIINDAGGDILRQESVGHFLEIECEAPVSKILGLLDGIDSIGEGNLRAYDDRIVGFKAVSGDRHSDIIKEIHQRKGRCPLRI